LPLIEHGKKVAALMLGAGTAEVLSAMELGDILRKLRPIVPRGQWRDFPSVQFGVCKTVANDCIKLAKARAVIEREMSGTAGQMSVRAALKLLRKPRAPVEKPAAPKPANLKAAWETASADERKAIFVGTDLDELRVSMPPEFFAQLRKSFFDQIAREEPAGVASFSAGFPPVTIVTARKLVRHAMDGSNTPEMAASAIFAASRVMAKGGFTYDDLLYVPGSGRAKKPPRRRAA
jgi:hypothetical protein